MRNDEISEAQKLEAVELRRKQEIERRKVQMREKKNERIEADKKLQSRKLAKDVLKPLRDDTIETLQK